MPETTEIAVETQTFKIPEENLSTLKTALDKLARKATKLGTAAISYTVGASEDIAYVRGNDLFRKAKAGETVELPYRLEYVRFFEFTVTGSRPRLAGWEFVATLQHLADDEGKVINLLRTVPSCKLDLPVIYRTATPENCDHCQKAIKTRKETFIVHHAEQGYLQVGRNCTQDFLGGQDPHSVTKGLELLLSALDSCSDAEEGFGGGSSRPSRYGLQDLLTVVAACCRVDGWCSRGRARQDESLQATADATLYILSPPPKDAKAYAEWRAFVEARKPTSDDQETAEKALDFAKDVLGAKTDRNDYEHNLYVATTQTSVDYKLVGIASSLVPYYLKEIERLVLREAEAKAGAGSKHFGEVGQRLDLYVKLTRLSSSEGNFGTTYIHSLITRDGNACTWFGSNNPELKPGAEYLVRATIKAHNEYRGVKGTVLSRLEVYTDEGRALAEAKAARKLAKLAKATKAQ